MAAHNNVLGCKWMPLALSDGEGVILRDWPRVERGRVFLVVEEAEMKFTVPKPFLFGFTCGIGITLLSLYTRKPGCFVTSIERLAEVGRTRRAKEEEKRMEKEWLRAAGYSDKEIDEVF